MSNESIVLWSGVLAVVLSFLYYLKTKNSDFWSKRGIRTVKNIGIIKSVFTKMTAIDQDREVYKQLKNIPYGGFFEISNPAVAVRDLEVIRHIYVKDFDHFVNRRKMKVDEKTKYMLVFQSDQEWKDLRALMTPTFTTGKIRRMFPLMNDSSKKLTTLLKEIIDKNDGIVNMEDVLGSYAINVISSAAFGIESGVFKDENSIVATMAKKLPIKFTLWVAFQFVISTILPFVPESWKLSFVNKESTDFFAGILKQSIKQRETSGEKRIDFLQLMIDLKNERLQFEKDSETDSYEKDAQLSESGKKNTVSIDDELIIANCLLFILGGYNTTQSALVFAAYALALNPDVQEKLRKEIQDAVEENGGELSYDMIHKLQYLDKVINETLRMYPPAVRNERQCTKDYTLPNTRSIIPKGTLIIIPVYQIHHDETIFPKPEVFDPERFSPEVIAKRSPYAFMPFGHGPRNCIANRFALTEVKTSIANLVLKFDLAPCEKTTIPMEFPNAPSLKPKDGMWLKLNSR